MNILLFGWKIWEEYKKIVLGKDEFKNELTSKIETDSQMESRLRALGGGDKGVQGSSQKEKGLLDTDSRVVIMVGRGI